jgi:hypothetical protein
MFEGFLDPSGKRLHGVPSATTALAIVSSSVLTKIISFYPLIIVIIIGSTALHGPWPSSEASAS